MIVFDSSVLIAHLVDTDRHHDRAAALLVSQIDDDFGASPLTLAEMLVTPMKHGRLEDALRAVSDLEVAELPLLADSPIALAKLRHETRLKVPDCCVLLAAQQHGARIASFDARLMAAAGAQGLELVEG